MKSEQPVIDAAHYGLSPSASASMNAKALQEAATEARRVGGVLYVPPGRYPLGRQ